MRELAALVKSSKTARGYDEVLVAGEPEWRTEALRRAQGIPLSEGVWNSLMEAARALHVALPEGV
jgi:LDH2 family malate/lactate/ureidoglycolate dehydrogenase